jgi:hypothetical protein
MAGKMAQSASDLDRGLVLIRVKTQSYYTPCDATAMPYDEGLER